MGTYAFRMAGVVGQSEVPAMTPFFLLQEFVHAVATKVPDIEDRLALWLFVATFTESVTLVNTSINTILQAQKILLDRHSQFTEVLAWVLKLGNKLNEGTSKGSASGFNVSDLSQVF